MPYKFHWNESLINVCDSWSYHGQLSLKISHDNQFSYRHEPNIFFETAGDKLGCKRRYLGMFACCYQICSITIQNYFRVYRFCSVFECFEECLVLLKIFNNFKPASLWIFQHCQLNYYVNFFDEGESSASGLFPKEPTTKSRAMRGKRTVYSRYL